jgi:signal transduction histidine kinase
MHDNRLDRLRGMERLVVAIKELSLARDLPTITGIVRTVARELTGADGATFVLRDSGCCFYVDEDAIEPLWKGRRFPLEACISGWSMLHRQPVRIEDIYVDARIPHDAYRPTFVKSLVMVPIRTTSPIGAIGNYWATPRRANDDEVKLLQALADSTSIAMENVDIVSGLEARVRERTAQLEAANRELEAFSYSVSHDLRAPVRAVDGFSRALEEDLEDAKLLDDTTRRHVSRIRGATGRMNALIDDMLKMAHVSRARLDIADTDLTAIARSVADELLMNSAARKVEFVIEDGLAAKSDRTLMRAVLENLLGNAFKFTSKVDQAKIEFGAGEGGQFFVKDNGAGFDMSNAKKLFGPFQRLHTQADFPGTGVGLATVQRIIHRHGGHISAQSEPGAGATFSFSLG